MRDDVQYFRDFYNVDRVEVLKGPNAMIFGRGGGGGIVNRVLKRPSSTAARSVTASADNWGARAIDGGRRPAAVQQRLGIRLNGVYEDSDSFRRHVELKRYGINPTVALLAGPNTRIDLGYEYFHDRRTADRGVPADGDEPMRGHTRDFFGDPGESFARANVNLATLAIEHQFGDGLTLKNRTMFGDYRQVLPEHLSEQLQRGHGPGRARRLQQPQRPQEPVQPDGPRLGNRLAGIDQTLLLGFEIGREKSRNKRLTATFDQPSERAGHRSDGGRGGRSSRRSRATPTTA